MTSKNPEWPFPNKKRLIPTISLSVQDGMYIITDSDNILLIFSWNRLINSWTTLKMPVPFCRLQIFYSHLKTITTNFYISRTRFKTLNQTINSHSYFLWHDSIFKNVFSTLLSRWTHFITFLSPHGETSLLRFFLIYMYLVLSSGNAVFLAHGSNGWVLPI